ncbi:bis-aminopropyl spermidine synthase family protein [Pleomorphomonas sp. JP5]|uniref:bis-aminopropyl spermidine synthase family protein n=1 Tax=Pleomorphomonas sp. JP5 TaxID=2942998 RepID=UPI002043589D|nr:bis-aminopropyl spermidine synthase family protein [Pleomorphomonas sp. JP5]MCM5559312.1 bis-aminopropyl spermidine synthase family protein [Pleomorphomonas sp. JP5]
MFGEYFTQLLQHSIEDIDHTSAILQHRNRPKANREHDQIYMLAGSQLQQAKLVGSYLADKRVVFMGDGDCMSLLVAYLSTKGIVPRPKHITVLDFDERLLDFIKSMRTQCGWHEDMFECHQYNVRYPIPENLKTRGDVFYTNPPYGFYNKGLSNRVFLARAMEFCKPSSRGIAILPYNADSDGSREAMTETQRFMNLAGYIIIEMILGQHRYDLDDRPELKSGTVIFDRVSSERTIFSDRELTEDEMKYFYSRTPKMIPKYISSDGTPIYDT